MLRAAVQRNFPKADVHAGLNTIDRNRSFAARAPEVRVADKVAVRCKCTKRQVSNDCSADKVTIRSFLTNGNHMHNALVLVLHRPDERLLEKIYGNRRLRP